MRIGYLRDRNSKLIGGAELSADALVAAAPEGVEMLYIPPGTVPETPCDAFVVFNCVQYGADALEFLRDAVVVKRVADFWPHGDAELRAWVLQNARRLVFLSKPHLDVFPHTCGTRTALCPPPVDIARFVDADMASTYRDGIFWMGQMWTHKGVQEAVTWAEGTKTRVDFYGDGPLRPRRGEFVNYYGQIAYEMVPELMASYDGFLYVPPVVEPFGRTVIEAWAAGCKLYINTNCGAMWWLENDLDAVADGAGRFWRIMEEATA